MSNRNLFLELKERQCIAEHPEQYEHEGAPVREQGFIGQHNSAIHKAGDMITEMQKCKCALESLLTQISNAWHSEQAEELGHSQAYRNLVLKANAAKADYAGHMDAYIEGLEQAAMHAKEEQYRILNTPIEPTTITTRKVA